MRFEILLFLLVHAWLWIPYSPGPKVYRCNNRPQCVNSQKASVRDWNVRFYCFAHSCMTMDIFVVHTYCKYSPGPKVVICNHRSLHVKKLQWNIQICDSIVFVHSCTQWVPYQNTNMVLFFPWLFQEYHKPPWQLIASNTLWIVEVWYSIVFAHSCMTLDIFEVHTNGKYSPSPKILICNCRSLHVKKLQWNIQICDFIVFAHSCMQWVSYQNTNMVLFFPWLRGTFNLNGNL